MTDRELYEEGLLMDLEKAKDRIEALIAERDEAWRRAAHAEEMWGKAEAKLKDMALTVLVAEGQAADAYKAQLDAEVKLSESEALLAKAVDALGEAIYLLDPDEEDIAKETGLYRIVTTYAELKGDNDE